MSKRVRYWKVLNEDGTPCNGGSGRWSLPHDGRPGEWMPRIDDIIPCQRGYHLCRDQDLLGWLGPVIYEAEARGPVIVHENTKVVAHEARLIRKGDVWIRGINRRRI